MTDCSIEGHRMVPLELLKENELEIKQKLKNQIAVSLCLLANGIPGFPCHPPGVIPIINVSHIWIHVSK